jgi:hypothetical protein
MEFFGWRAFRNRRELAALAGLIAVILNYVKRSEVRGIAPV